MKNCILTLSALAFGTAFAMAQAESSATPQPIATQGNPTPTAPQPALREDATQATPPASPDAPAPDEQSPTTPPATPQASPEEAMKQILATLPPDTDKSEMLQKALELFPNTSAYSVSESTQSINGKGEKTITLHLVDKDGGELTFSRTWDQEAPTSFDWDTTATPPFSPEDSPVIQSFSDPLTESIIEQGQQLCDLLQSITTKEEADAAAPKLQALCQSLESNLATSRSRRLSPMAEGLLLLKYEDALNTILPMTDTLISDLAAKNYYGSEALRAVAESFCE